MSTLFLVLAGASALVIGLVVGLIATRVPIPGGAGLWGLIVRYRRVWPAVGIVAATTVAYWFTLSSLADYLRLDTPLAYLLVLPLFSLLLAIVIVLRYRGAPPARRMFHIDLLIGAALLVVALLAVTVLPAAWSTYYWVERPDVISLVLFASGCLVLCYGATWLWRLRSAIVFLFLMWPALYLHLMAGPMQSLTDATNAVLTSAAQHVQLGVTSGAGGILTVQMDGGQSLAVTLSTACSGANGLLGVALVGSAMACMFNGRRLNKLLWLFTGLFLVFVFNVARIISILTLARWGHPSLALGGYHAVIGVVLFTVTILVMRLIAPLYKLRWSVSELAARSPAPGAATIGGPARTRTRLGLAVALTVTAGLALFAERDLGTYAAFVDGTGAPTVAAFSLSDPLPNGWGATFLATYDWAQQYFGPHSKFDRYVLHYGSNNSSQAWLDVVRTDDRGSFDAYNLQSCFLFHNYSLENVQRIDLSRGVTALLINYSDPPTKAQWATVSWALPVMYQGDTNYERITLTADLHRDGGPQAPNPEPSTGLRGLLLSLLNSFGGHSPDADQVFRTTDRALEGVATSIVDSMMRSSVS